MVHVVRSRLLIMMRELPFGGQPVIKIVAIAPPTDLVEVVCEASDLVP
jgi:hypothetical protein